MPANLRGGAILHLYYKAQCSCTLSRRKFLQFHLLTAGILTRNHLISIPSQENSQWVCYRYNPSHSSGGCHGIAPCSLTYAQRHITEKITLLIISPYISLSSQTTKYSENYTVTLCLNYCVLAIINIPTHSVGYFIFRQALNAADYEQMRLLLACRPHIGLLTARKQVF